MDFRKEPKAERASEKVCEGVSHQVLLSQGFNKEFVGLKIKATKGDGEAKYLLKIISKGIEKLKKDKEVGKRIKKGRIPAYYSSKYEVTNLWKLNLDIYWRMVYTIMGDEIRLMTIVLDILDHKKYERRFGYHG